ncbi:hypothetical protein LTS14_003518 [Recurvomyces mirabilis]|uniref:uncharacterized protein n=1 Tax=Recurvomyces mirabilis TaxID=574656 RepID=UPI002DE0B6D1|nr:hypothetical protein LTS14_003518 [Recurvomyces mirabilis]
MLKNFHELYPESMAHLNRLRFIEQYDPTDIGVGSGSQPFAYVADIVQEVKLGVCVDEVTTKGIKNEQWSAILELRDKLAPEEKVGWFVVVCGDEERWAPPTIAQLEAGARNGSLNRSDEGYSDSDVGRTSGRHVEDVLTLYQGKPQSPPEEPEPRGLRKLFGSRSRRKSVKSISRPPLPNMPRSTSSGDLTLRNTHSNPGKPPPMPGAAA